MGMFLILAVFDEADRQDDPTIVLLGGLLFALVQAIALVWRQSSPERATAVVLAGGLGFQLLYPQMVVPFAGLLVIGSLAAQRPRSVSLVGLAALLVLAATNIFTTTVEDTVFTMGLAVGAWALGDASRNRRLAKDEEERAAMASERARIARELHDVIAHSVSMIVVQAAAADDVFDERPDQARESIRSIERAGREALVELRRLLSAVRPGRRRDRRAPARPRSGRRAGRARCAPAASRWRSTARARPACCRPASTCPPTASSRRRSPTRCATRTPRGPR